MESLSTSDALVRPWRTATFVVSAVAVAELLVLLGIAVVVFGRPLLDAAKGSVSRSGPAARSAHQKPAPVAPVTRAGAKARRHTSLAPKLRRGQTSVLVLNGNGIAGAAASESAAVRARGYVVAAVGNAERTDYTRSVVMYRPGFKPEAARLARDLRVRTVSPLDGLRIHDLQGAHVAVVIGR